MGGLPANQTVNGFAVDPQNPKVMYAGMRDGLFKSTDAGASWELVTGGPKSVAAIAVNPKKPSEVYAATTVGAVYKSADAGTKWEQVK